MTDLINKVEEMINTDIASVQVLVDKYRNVLEITKIQKDIPYLAFLIDICVEHLNSNHNNLSKDWKTWATIAIRNLFLDKKLENIEDIAKTIDEFIVFWKSNYEKYCDDIIAATDYDKERGFVFRFELQKNR